MLIGGNSCVVRCVSQSRAYESSQISPSLIATVGGDSVVVFAAFLAPHRVTKLRGDVPVVQTELDKLHKCSDL